MLLYGSETLKHLPVVKIKVERRRSIYQVPGHVVARWLEQGSGIEISSASDVGSARSFRIAVLTFLHAAQTGCFQVLPLNALPAKNAYGMRQMF